MRVGAGLAGVAASSLVIGLAAVPAARAEVAVTGATAADSPSATLYVNGASSSCRDGGAGTQTVPFCTIQAAADVVNPGQTVSIQNDGSQNYQRVAITRSGTPSAPITFTGVQSPVVSESAGGAALTLADVHDVDISDLSVTHGGSDDGIDIVGSTRITLANLGIGSQYLAPTEAGTASVDVDGGSAHIMISRNWISEGDGTSLGPGYGTAVKVHPGAQDVTITTGKFDVRAGSAVDAGGATGVNVTSNTVIGCGTGINVSAGATAVLENNAILSYRYSYCSDYGTGISVAADSTGTTRTDYNAFVGPSSATDYAWGGTAYTGIAAFAAATGQGAHDLVAPSGASIRGASAESSPLIDSADCSAPGEQATDWLGNPYVDDRIVADTGTGTCHADRGAYERQDGLVAGFTITPGSLKVVADQDVTVSLAGNAGPTSSWGEPVTYTADFGDGYRATVTPGGPVSHAYTTTGTHTITVLAADPGGSSISSWQPVTVYPATAPSLTLTAKPFILTGYPTPDTVAADEAVFTGSAGPGNSEIASAAINYGDGTSAPVAVAAAGLASASHIYGNPGTYTATLTATDALGRQSTVSTRVTVGDETDFSFNTPFVAFSHTVAAHAVVRLSPRQLGLTWTAGDPAVFVTVTVSSPKKAGYVTVYPTGAARPQTAAVQFLAGQSASNITLATAGSGQSVSFYNGSSGSIDLTIHAIGFEEGRGLGDGMYAPTTPAVVLAKARIAGQRHVAFPVAGLHGVPQGLPNASGWNVVLDITASGGAAAGYFTAGPEKTTYVRMPEPGAYWARGQQVTGLAVVPVNGRVVLSNVSSGAADFTATVVGYYAPSTTGAVFLPTAPRRLMHVQVAGKHWVKPGVAGKNGVPAATSAGSTTAVAVNLTASGGTANGTITAYPDGTTRPASLISLSYSKGGIAANAAIVAVSPDGTIDLYNAGLRPVILTVDLTGAYYSYS